MSNEPLFDKIKSELEGYQPAYDPADWDKMEQMLGEKKRIVPLWMWRAAAGVAILIGLSTAAYFGLRPADDALTAEESNHSTFKLGFSSSENSNSKETGTTSNFSNTEDATGNEELLAVNQRVKDQISESSTNAASRSNISVSGFNSGKNTNAKTGLVPPVKKDENKSAKNENTEHTPASKLSMSKFTGEEETFENRLNPSLNDIIAKNRERRNNEDKKTSWWAGASLKPSMQVVNNAKSAFGQGIIAGVDFNNNMGIETGLFYEQLKYEESAETGLMFSADHVSTQGNFRGVSIPVHFNYRFNKDGVFQPVLNAGLTAFIPTKEQYVFSYSQPISSGGTPSNFSSASAMSDTLQVNRSVVGRKSETADLQTYGNTSYDNIRGDSKDIYMMASAGAGLRYYFNTRFSFQVSANYVQPLSNVGIEGRNIRQVDVGLAMQYQIN